MQQGITADEFKADVKLQAADEAKHQLALDAWARRAGIEATDEEVSREFELAGVENPAALEKEWRETGRLYLIREGIIRRKAVESVMEGAVVTEVDYAAQAQQERKDAIRRKAVESVMEGAVVTEVDYAAQAQQERKDAKKPSKKKSSKKDEAAQAVVTEVDYAAQAQQERKDAKKPSKKKSSKKDEAAQAEQSAAE